MKTAREVERDYLNASKANRKNGLVWYSVAREECETLAKSYSLSLPIVAGVVSAVSPLCPWADNLQRAKRLISWHHGRRKGKRPPVTFGKNCDKADRILSEGRPDDEFRNNTKTRSFFLNLCGNLGPVTIDTWMLVYHGSLRSTLTQRQYWDACGPIVAAANRLGIMPAQLQAVLWLQTREEASLKPSDPIPL